MEKILIIRLSSFGDIVQSLVCLESIKTKFPKSEIHWLVRSDFKTLVENHPLIDQVHRIEKGSKWPAIKACNKKLQEQNFTHVYDAHNNTRSNLLGLLFLGKRIFGKVNWIERPKNRIKRFLLFRFKWNLLPRPFVLMKSYLEPLKKWGIEAGLTKNNHIYLSEETKFLALKQLGDDIKNYIVMAPSAAWELKRWPVDHWIQLCDLMPDKNIVFLGGPADEFIETDIISKLQTRQGQVINLAGKLKIEESCALIENASFCVGGDSGLTHTGDSFAVPTFCIIGAAAFAYPARKTTVVLDHKLSCKPCSKDGRGKCTNKVYKACLVGIEPRMISSQILGISS